MKCLVLAGLAIVLTRERRFVSFGALGYCAVRFLIALALTLDWRALVGFVTTGLPLLWYTNSSFWTDYKPSYEWPNGFYVVDLLVGLSSLGVSITTASWIYH